MQSSVMALMAGQGGSGRVPDCAIFAETHWDPPSIYAHLEWLAGQLRFPMYVVDNVRPFIAQHSHRRFPGITVIPQRQSGCSDLTGAAMPVYDAATLSVRSLQP